MKREEMEAEWKKIHHQVKAILKNKTHVLETALGQKKLTEEEKAYVEDRLLNALWDLEGVRSKIPKIEERNRNLGMRAILDEIGGDLYKFKEWLRNKDYMKHLIKGCVEKSNTLNDLQLCLNEGTRSTGRRVTDALIQLAAEEIKDLLRTGTILAELTEEEQ